MASPSGLVGIAVMILAGLAVTAEMVFSRVLLRLAWPYWRITALSCVLCDLGIFVGLLFVGTAVPNWFQCKWLSFSGFFGAIYWGLSIVAVQVGAGPGDVAALTSINIVAAAVMGRLFLNEGFYLLHTCALVLSVSGAVLVAQPEFLFSKSSGAQESAWLGYVFAVASGILQGCFFISTRRVGEISGWVVTLSLLFWSVPLCLFIPFTPFVEESSLAVVAEAPGKAAFYLLIACATTAFSASTCSIGSALCPAAVSATVYTAASMTFGYLAQVVLFGAAPGILTLLGAGLMMLAVLCTACAGGRNADASKSEVELGSSEARDVKGDADEVESIYSFAAYETGEFTFSTTPLRFRAPTGPDVEPQSIGATTP
mmetsp:Transcript_51430/g.143791  ORF Transcript_51430/g.143791 Transcript_51430/m.143791 type:complete len:371 (-) Transcript_51430:154-1266(-)